MNSRAAGSHAPQMRGNGVQAQIWPVLAVMWGLAAIALIANA